MTRRISLVAVCCSRASVRSRLRPRSSCEQAHVLDGDDGLVGEGLEQLDLRRRRTAPAPPRMTTIAPIGRPSRSIGTASTLRKPPAPRDLAARTSGSRLHDPRSWTTALVEDRPPGACVRRSGAIGNAPLRARRAPRACSCDGRRGGPARRRTGTTAPTSRAAQPHGASRRSCRRRAGRRSASSRSRAGSRWSPSAARAVSVRSRLRRSSSVNRRTFSMAMTAWSAKVWSSAIWLVGEGTDLGAADDDGADGAAFSQHRHAKYRAEAAVATRSLAGHGNSARRSAWTSATWTVAPIEHRAACHRPVDREGRVADSPDRQSGRGGRRRARRISVPTSRSTASERLAEPAALSAIASNTGWTSVGEPEMTRRISPVAVCCSSASVRSRLRASSSLNSRTFSMAMTAWSAKVFTSSICVAVKGLTSRRPQPIAPIGTPFRRIGTPRYER